MFTEAQRSASQQLHDIENSYAPHVFLKEKGNGEEFQQLANTNKKIKKK